MIRKYRNNKKVIYTCLIGGYDKLIDHKYINPDWDYICFTDDLSIKNKNNSSWKVKPLIFNKLDDVRNQRWHKINAHLILSEYEESLYLDTNIEILNDGIFEDIEKVKSQKNIKISLGYHFERDNLFDEFIECKKLGKDNIDILNEQEKKIRESGFSGKFGVFFENNIIYRRHNDKDVVKIMNEWWWWIKNYSRRDQLSLTYVLWKNNYRILPLNKKTYRESDKVKFIFSEKHITKEELIFQRDNLKNDLNIKDKRIEEKNKEIEDKNKEIDIKNKEIEEKNKEILLLKSSKFWKLRNFYLKVKHYFIFIFLNPRKFFRKYFK
jgi:hypothetical protein